MGMMKPEMGAKMKALEAKMKTEAAEAEKLLEAMNASIGDRKIEAIAAILNKAAQKEKTMKAMCEQMMKGGMDKTDGKAGAQGYYTCSMHPEIRWPIPAKCPICAMDLVPVSKKASDAKPGEEARKAEDPHAGHH
jgi:rubrerythrin